MEKEFVSTSSAANKLGVLQTTIQRWLCDGALRAIKVGPVRNSPYRVENVSPEALVEELNRRENS